MALFAGKVSTLIVDLPQIISDNVTVSVFISSSFPYLGRVNFNYMKKILEILQYGETDIRFKTDLKPTEKPDTIPGLIGAVSFSMMTSLWGGNELDILAIIRALAIADLAVSVNREEMISMMDQDSAIFARILQEAHQEFRKNGGKAIQFAPFIQPGKTTS